MSYPISLEFIHPQSPGTLIVSNHIEYSLRTFDFPNLIHSPLINGEILEYSINESNERKLKKGSNA